MKAENVVIIGAGGHAKVVADIVLLRGNHIAGFLDSVHPEGEFLGYPKLGGDREYRKFLNCSFIIAIGNALAREDRVLYAGGGMVYGCAPRGGYLKY